MSEVKTTIFDSEMWFKVRENGNKYSIVKYKYLKIILEYLYLVTFHNFCVV